jgi:hypothetical protein
MLFTQPRGTKSIEDIRVGGPALKKVALKFRVYRLSLLSSDKRFEITDVLNGQATTAGG